MFVVALALDFAPCSASPSKAQLAEVAETARCLLDGRLAAEDDEVVGDLLEESLAGSSGHGEEDLRKSCEDLLLDRLFVAED